MRRLLARPAIFGGIAALFLFGPIEEKHFSDVEDNAVYWYFMTLVWVPLYFLLYISPRIL